MDFVSEYMQLCVKDFIIKIKYISIYDFKDFMETKRDKFLYFHVFHSVHSKLFPYPYITNNCIVLL